MPSSDIDAAQLVGAKACEKNIEMMAQSRSIQTFGDGDD
jgi:hypothetical protein